MSEGEGLVEHLRRVPDERDLQGLARAGGQELLSLQHHVHDAGWVGPL